MLPYHDGSIQTYGAWWLGADDPWQAVAAAMEISEAINSADPEQFMSNLPVHQDGSCNGSVTSLTYALTYALCAVTSLTYALCSVTSLTYAFGLTRVVKIHYLCPHATIYVSCRLQHYAALGLDSIGGEQVFFLYCCLRHASG